MTRLLLAILGLAVVLMGASAWMGGPAGFDTLNAAEMLFIAAIVCGLLGIGLGITDHRHRQEAVARLGAALRAALSDDTAPALGPPPREFDPALGKIWRLAASFGQRTSPDTILRNRLAAVLGALPQPVIVVTDRGLVTLANRPAMDLLGSERLRTGTSIFDAIHRESLAPLLNGDASGTSLTADLALVDGRTLAARLRALPDHGGLVIVLDAISSGEAGLHHAMDLHEASPPRRPPTPDTPLDQLTAMVLDCESTGLNVGFDRLLSLGAVRLQGPRLVRSETIDAVFDPGEPIPAASTAIHGITDGMAMGERPLAERWADIEPGLRDCVIIGHNIGFDLTLLEIELRRAGIRWQRPPSLCTAQLASVLDPGLSDLNLESIAAAYGLEVAGRHTALGDALATAEIYLHLLALMQAKGDRILADAQARAATARRVIRQQEAAGW